MGDSTLVVDYGADHAVGNSFHALKGHALSDPFDRPGKADLTANVNFAYLAEALKGTGTSALLARPPPKKLGSCNCGTDCTYWYDYFSLPPHKGLKS